MQRSLSPGVWPTRRSSTTRWFTALVVGLLLPFSGLTAWAQPTVLGTSIAAGSYATYNLNAVSAFRQVTIQATGTIGAGTGVWEYARGTAASTDYSVVWRPYSAGLTFSGFNNFIPTSAAEGAKYNTGAGGSSGRLPAVTSGRYYTFNVANNGSSDNAMQVLETAFNPVSISTVTASGTGFQTGTPITVNIATSAAPATGENVYVRYSTNAFVSNNNLVQATFSGTSGVAQIPSQAAGTTLTYYVFSSNKTITQINSDNTTYSTALGYDLATLRLNNNSGANYTYAVNAAVAGNVLVQSSGGTTAITSYGTVGAAFAKINDGTHTGTISVFLNTATITETTSGSFLLTSGTGSASYTSVTVQPIIDAVTVTATVSNGNGTIGLIGASNVTIDGDNPNSTGTNRNLTIANTNTAANAAVVRLTGVTTPAVTATNDIIRNCILTGSNANSTSYGIYAGSDAATPVSLTSGTTVGGTGKYASLTINNNLIQTTGRAIYVGGTSAATNVSITNNTLGSATAGNLSAVGIALSNTASPVITGNTIRNLTAAFTNVGAGSGIYLYGGTASPNVSGNSITNISSTVSNTTTPSVQGILLEATVTSATVAGNTISNVTNNTTGGFTAVGIFVAATNAATIYNNSISGINAIFNNSLYGTTYGVFGIDIAAGTGHKVYYNSVYLQGSPLSGGTGAEHTAGLLIVSSAQTGVDVRNNIFANYFSATSAYNTAISLPSGLTSGFNLTLNNNAYYAPTTTGNYIAHAFGSSAVGTTYTAANFNAAATSPATNLRSYTSTLSAAGTNDNLSFASNGTVPFTSTTNLSIPAGTTTLVESGATFISGITTDLPGTTRATGNTFPVTGVNTNPDMGAYEGSYALPASATVNAISYTQSNANTARSATNQQVTGLNINITGTTSPRVLNSITFNLGSTSAADITNARLYSTGSSSTFATTTLVTTTGTIASPSYTLTLTPATLAAGDNYFFLTYDIASGATSGNTVASTPTTVTVSSTGYTSATAPAITLSGSAGVRTIIGPLSGTYTVGQPTITVPSPSYATITAAIADLTLRGVSGPVSFSLINPGTTPYNTANGETFPLNVTAYAGFSATNTVTFKPALLTSPLVSNGSASALFKLTDVSYVTIDGSNTPGGTSRDLSFTNTNTAGTALVWIATSGTGLSHDNKVLNLTLQGGSNASTNLSTGVMVSGTSYNNIGADNDNLTISNNTVQGTYMGIVAGGTAVVSSGGLDGLVITNNVVGPATAATANNITLYGIFVQGAVAPSLTGNTVQNVVNSAAANYGIILSNNNAGITGGTVSSNTVSGVSSGGGSAYGLSSAASAVTLSANTVSNVSSSNNNAYGLNVTGATSTVSANTVINVSSSNNNTYGLNLTGATSSLLGNVVSSLSSTAGYTYGLYLGAGSAGNTTTPAVVDRNKISTLTGTASGGYTGYGIYVAPGAANANLRISNNFVADLRGTGFTGITNGGIVGILLNGATTAQSGISLYHNSVSLSGSYTPGTTSAGLVTAALAVTAGNTGLDIRNNIFANTLASTSGTSTSYAFYSAAALAAYTAINYNDYYVSGTQGVLAYFNGGNRATLAALQDATNGTNQDANSVTGNPNFTSTTDLHIAPGASKAESNGVLIAAAGNDVDNQARGPYPLAAPLNGGGTAPDLGADEGDFTPAPVNDAGITALTSPTATQVCYTGTETVTVTLRNFSGTTLNFATSPVTVSGSVSGPNNTTLVPVIINTGTLAAGATQAVTFVTPANMSTPGTYTFAIASSVSGGDSDNTNDALPGTPAGTNTRTTIALTAGTASASASTVCGTSSTVTLTLTGAAGGSIQWQSSPDNLLFSNISGATTTPYTTAAIAQTTYYKAVVSCGTSSATSNTLTVTVSDPQVTFVNAPSRCGAGTVTLQATASPGNTPYYFTTLTGGAPFASGISATATVAATPATQTFYVEARNGTLNVTGEQSSSSAATGSTFTPTNTTADRALGFNVTSAGVLNSVDVYPSAVGTLTIRLYTATNPGTGTAVSGADRTFTITAAQVGTLVTLPLNYSLAAGGYKLSNPTGGLGRYSTYTGTYPITNGVIAVVGSYNTAAGSSYNTSTYNSFFNLAYTTGGPGCASSPRTALAVTVTTPPALTYTGSTTICNGSSTTLTFSPASYTTLTVSPTTGATVNNAAHTVTFNPTANTIYTITGNDGNGPTGCTATTTLTIVVNPTPNAPTLTPGSASICAGTSTTVTASSNALTNPTILTQNFNSGLGSWTASNNGGGAATVWGIITPPYTYSTYLTAWNGADGTPMAFANSDAGGTGSVTNTLLTSPSFNTTGYTAATVAFDHLLRVNSSNTTAKVQYSVNGGTWTDLVTYTTSQGTGPTTATPTVARPALTLPAAALNQADVRIRFSYVDAFGYYWALDNVAVTGTINEAPTYTVTPTAGASVSGSTITFNPTATTTYNVTASYPNSTGCPSPATPITITVTPVATANAGTAPAKVCAGYTYSTTGSFGGSATSATYTSSGTGTFSNGGVINGTTTSVTYSPSAADITAGAVTLTLTTSGPCAAVASTLPLTINSTSTWTGASSTEWNDAGNWDNCIPNLQVNAIVPAGTTRSIGDGSYANSCSFPTNRTMLVKNLTVASGAYMEIYSHNLSIAGNLSNSGDMYMMFSDGCFTYNNLRFVGTTAQTAAGMPDVYTAEVANTGAANDQTVTVTSARSGGSSFNVQHALTMTSGLLNLNSATTLVISDDMFYGTLTETNLSYVLGAVRAKEYLSDNTPTTFSNLGLTLTADAASTTFPDETVVTRHTGTVLNGAGTSQSVKRWFRIVPLNDAGLNVSLKMDLFEHERNGIANANLQLFSAPIPAGGGAPAGPWAPYRASALVAASNGSYATAVQMSSLTHLSDWTLGNSANPLPVELTKFEAVRNGGNAILNWTTASEKNNAGFEVQVSTDGRAFRKLHVVEPASSRSTSVRNYTYTDLEAGKAGLRYYRLRQMDLDGNASFSPVRTVDFGQPVAASLTAAPNPFQGELTLTIQSRQALTDAPLTLLDATGRPVYETRLTLPAGSSQLVLPELSRLPNGVYLLHLSIDGKVHHLKVVKQ